MPVRTVRRIPFLAVPLLFASVLYLFPVTVSAQSDTSKQSGKNGSELDSLVEFTAFPDTNEIEAGDTFSLVFHARMKPEWHIYWENSGETGMETQISVDAPDGFEVGSIQWPRPITFKTGNLTTYGYGKETVLFVPVTAPETLPEGPHTFQAKVTSLACREKCIIQKHNVSATVPSDKLPDDELKNTVKRHREAIPEPFSSLTESRVTWEDDTIVFEGSRNGAEQFTFFPVPVSGVELGSPSVSTNESTFTMRIPVEWHPDNHLGEEQPAVKGVIAVGDDPFGPSYRVSVPLERQTN